MTAKTNKFLISILPKFIAAPLLFLFSGFGQTFICACISAAFGERLPVSDFAYVIWIFAVGSIGVFIWGVVDTIRLHLQLGTKKHQ